MAAAKRARRIVARKNRRRRLLEWLLVVLGRVVDREEVRRESVEGRLRPAERRAKRGRVETLTRVVGRKGVHRVRGRTLTLRAATEPATETGDAPRERVAVGAGRAQR